MHKIIRQSLKNDYILLTFEVLHKDSVIDFDCYIKRFNGYVIIIERGTLMTEELIRKISKMGNLYLHTPELKKYQDYCKRYEIKEEISSQTTSISDESEAKELPTLDEIIENISTLPLQIRGLEDYQDKLHLVYKNACHLMGVFFSHQDNELAIDSLELLIDVTLQLTVRSKTLLISFTKMMPSAYKIECHSVNVAILSIFLGRKLGLQRTDLQQLALAAILHDIGKIGIDTSILEKKGKLDDFEFEEIQEHSKISVEIASKNMIRAQRILDAILFHHERLDGTGYPEGRTEKDIPRSAQIIGICDVFDALTTDKTYRTRYSSFDALRLMSHDMSRQLNQDYVKSFIQLLHK